MFNASKYRAKSQTNQGIKPTVQKRDSFSLYGGKMSSKRLQRLIDRARLTQTQREYAKQVMAKHDRYGSKGVTKKEFQSGLDEMLSNTRDPIKQKDIETLKKQF